MTAKQRRQLAVLDAMLADRRAAKGARQRNIPAHTPERIREMYLRLTDAGVFTTPKPGTWAYDFREAIWPADTYSEREEQSA